MRVAPGQFSELTHERLTFARQIGVSGVQMNTPLLGYHWMPNGAWRTSNVSERGERRCDRRHAGVERSWNHRGHAHATGYI